MRVHGEVKIKRRNTVSDESDYHNYMDSLADDFGHICGYCGKSEMVTTKGFEIDHFVPNDIDSSRKTDYNNLVYSCFSCNRKKSKKWPTENKAIAHNSIEGFVDPATDEYDEHLERNVLGEIVHKSDVGKYMCEKAFKFSQRPMKEIWKYMQILSKQKMLQDRIHSLSIIEFEKYIELDIMVKELHKFLFSKKE